MREKELLEEIDTFLARTQPRMSDTAFGKSAINDGKLVGQLRAGKRRLWPETIDRIRAFMRDKAAASPINTQLERGATA